MKKRLIIVIVIITCLIAVGGWCYYKYIEEVTERYLVKYTEPHEEYGFYRNNLQFQDLFN